MSQKKEESQSKRPVLKSVGKALQYLQKRHKDNIAFMADDNAFDVRTEVLPSSSYNLNDVLGVGGLPSGRLIQFAGVESSGKTLLSLDIVKKMQESDPNSFAVYIDAERSFSRTWAAQLGVDLDRLIVIKESHGIEIWKTLVGDPQKDKQPGLLSLVENDPDYAGLKLIILDSIAAIIPPADENYHAGKESMATLARFLGSALKRVTPGLADTGVTMIAINQVREKPGVMYGDPTTSPGGKALKHACSVMVHLAKINKAECVTKDEDGEIIGHRIRARIDKNKVAAAYKVAEFDIEYVKGIVNLDKEAVDMAIKYEVVKQRGPMYYFADQSFKGKKALYDFLSDNNSIPQLLASVQEIKQGKRDGLKDDLAKLSLSVVIERAVSLGVEIPEGDVEDKDAIVAHIRSLSSVDKADVE